MGYVIYVVGLLGLAVILFSREVFWMLAAIMTVIIWKYM